ncbi:unnamed protein product [Closterium sp. Yama58-4]|nr:unnamed protein product [Closterium sp. Yama58-4]
MLRRADNHAAASLADPSAIPPPHFLLPYLYPSSPPHLSTCTRFDILSPPPPSLFSPPSIMAGQPLPKPPPPPAPVIPPPSPSPAPPASPPVAIPVVSAPAPAPPAAAAGAGGEAGAREKELLGLGLAELRQMARAQGVRGDTKAQIVAALLAQQAATPVKAKPPSPPPAAPAAAASPAPTVAKPAPKPAAPKPAAPKPAAAKAAGEKAAGEKGEKGEVERALEAMDMGELRYLARERGLKGDTKEELVKALAEGPPPTLGFIGLPPPSAPRRRRMPRFRAPPKDAPAPANAAAAAAAGAEQAEGEQEKAQAEEGAAVVEEEAREVEVAAGAEAVLPPFQSTAAPDSPSPAPVLPLTPGEMAGEVARLREAVAGMRGEVEEEVRRVKGESEEERSSKYLRSAVIGGVGLALLPLLLPALISSLRQTAPPSQARVELASETAVLLQSLLAAESSSLSELQALVPLIAPDLDAATRADRAAMFCQAVPPASRSPQADRFCNAVSAVRGGSEGRERMLGVAVGACGTMDVHGMVGGDSCRLNERGLCMHGAAQRWSGILLRWFCWWRKLNTSTFNPGDLYIGG